MSSNDFVGCKVILQKGKRRTLLLVGVYTFLEKESSVSFTSYITIGRDSVSKVGGREVFVKWGTNGYSIIKHNYIHSEYMMLTL